MNNPIEGGGEKGSVSPRETFEQMGERWERINEPYVGKVREFFRNPTIQVSAGELAALRRMQAERLEIESKLLKMLEG